jgi:hypothetical protein
VKSRAGHRIIPVHPKLVELGFMEFVRGVNTKRLFEDVPLDKSGYAGPSLGKRWTRLVKRLNADEPRTGYHTACATIGLMHVEPRRSTRVS